MLTPNDIAGKGFAKAFNGYNKSEVDEFLDKISEHLEALIRESDYFKSQVTETEKKLTEYQLLEESLKDALLVAQITSNEMKKKAAIEAKRIVAEATAQANKEMKLADQEAEETIAKSKADAAKNIDQAKHDYKQILNATDGLKKDYMDFKEKYQYILREQIEVLDRLEVEDELTAG